MKIRSISKAEPCQTLDLCIEGTHSYQLHNGVVVHNTAAKMFDTTSGIHKPLSKYIIEKIIISMASPIFEAVKRGNYRWTVHPFDSTSALVELPIAYEDVEFDVVEHEGKTMEINLESAIDQLNRYKLWMDHWADHNVSITVSYSPDEVEDIVNWLHNNWNSFVGISFMLRASPLKTAEELGYAYLPQTPITKEEYDEYISQINPVSLDELMINSLETLTDDECKGGVCPIR